MIIPDLHALAQALTDAMLIDIPINQAMGLRLQAYDGQRLSFQLPLAPNINDKHCVFGGSLASALTVAGWGLVVLALRQRGESGDVFIGESSIRYLSPVWGDFVAEAQLADGADWEAFFAAFKARGRARIEVTCVVPGAQGKPLACLQGRFVAKRTSQ